MQGSLARFAIWRWGSEEQKLEWLSRMAIGGAIGCFGLTEADRGSDPGGMPTSAKRDGGDWVLNGSKMWITNGSVSQVAVIWDTDRRGHWGLRGANQHPWILGAGDQAQALTSRLGDERAGQGQSALARRRGAS